MNSLEILSFFFNLKLNEFFYFINKIERILDKMEKFDKNLFDFKEN